MTNEQAIKWLNGLKANEILSATKEALDMAIKALKEEKPQGDLISREALKKHITEIFDVEEKIDKKWALGLKYSLKIIDNAPTAGCTPSDDSTGKLLTLGDLLGALRTAQYERVEIRDKCGNEILTCPVDSAGIAAYLNYHVTEWFPHGAPNKDATFTVYVEEV